MHLRFSSPIDLTKDYPAGEICSNIEEIKNSILERKFSFTESGKRYLAKIGTSEEQVALSYRGTLENYCIENGMIKGTHYTVSETRSMGAIYHREMMQILEEKAKLKFGKSPGRRKKTFKSAQSGSLIFSD